MTFSVDRLAFGPNDVDLNASPLHASMRDAGEETFVLGAFNPGLTRLPNGNLLMLVRIAEALRNPIHGGAVHAIRWTGAGYASDAHPIDNFDLTDPRSFGRLSGGSQVLGLTSLSWLLPVELSPDGLEVLRVHYDKAIAPRASYQEYGIEDARISVIDGVYYVTACAVSAERHATALYTSRDGLNYDLQGLVLDHQNKDMVLFEGLIGGKFWALTRPSGGAYFIYPEASPYHAGPSINLATSPDAVHWKPHDAAFIRPRKHSVTSVKVGGGAQPVLTPRGWLMLYHGVASNDSVGAYRTLWALLDADDPSKILHLDDEVLLEGRADLTKPLQDQMYLNDIVFTTGVVSYGDDYIVASGEADLACRITHIPKSTFA